MIGRRVTAQEARQWQDDGFFIRPNEFSGAELVRYREASERVAKDALKRASRGEHYQLDGNRFVDLGHVTLQYEHSPESTKLRVIEPVHELDRTFRGLVADSRLTSPMRDLVGSETLTLWTAKLNFKSAREGSGFGWHQDSPYWIHAHTNVDRLPNVFVAFDDSVDANGGLQLVRGSHTKGCLPGLADGSQLEGFYTHPDHIDQQRIVTAQLPAGSLLFFNPHIIHGSQPNATDKPRRALIATYQESGLPELKSGRIGAEL